MKKVLVTGANGQLGHCVAIKSFRITSSIQFVFFGSKELDITNKESVEKVFKAQ